jgi:hypothetical protein
MDGDVSPVLHNKDPAGFETVNKEFSQLLTTTTIGVAGITFGAAIPLPGELLHPFTD